MRKGDTVTFYLRKANPSATIQKLSQNDANDKRYDQNKCRWHILIYQIFVSKDSEAERCIILQSEIKSSVRTNEFTN